VSAEATRLRANPQQLPKSAVAICGALIAVGVVSFLVGLGSDATTAWRAFHVNYLYFGAMSQAGLALSCALVIVGARWAGPIRHVAEGLAAWVPVTFVLFLLSYFGRESIYSNWIHGGTGKEHWLNVPRFYIVDGAILGVLTLLTLRYLRTSFRPALHGAAGSAPAAKSRFAAWTAGWKGEAAEREDSLRRLRTLAPIVALLYAFGWGFLGFDQVMSLNPTWYSNIFAWYFAWGGWLSAVAATALICVLLRATTPGWAAEITKDRMHDVGKMVFAFSIFWMYLFFAQYIVIWYGNFPEETQFYMQRLGTQFLQDYWQLIDLERLNEPYVKLGLAAWLGCWWIPFWVLLGQKPKKTPVILGSVAALVLLGFWLERNALVWPSLVPKDGGAWAGGIQFGVAAGFLGAFALVYLVFSRVFPSLPVSQQSH
jgi:hypothetical protein